MRKYTTTTPEYIKKLTKLSNHPSETWLITFSEKKYDCSNIKIELGHPHDNDIFFIDYLPTKFTIKNYIGLSRNITPSKLLKLKIETIAEINPFEIHPSLYKKIQSFDSLIYIIRNKNKEEEDDDLLKRVFIDIATQYPFYRYYNTNLRFVYENDIIICYAPEHYRY